MSATTFLLFSMLREYLKITKGSTQAMLLNDLLAGNWERKSKTQIQLKINETDYDLRFPQAFTRIFSCKQLPIYLFAWNKPFFSTNHQSYFAAAVKLKNAVHNNLPDVECLWHNKHCMKSGEKNRVSLFLKKHADCYTLFSHSTLSHFF